ncbi:MAG: CDP-diacylglycerol--glycerol-3-phosphate 3-phosphatidyltransferase [Desulfobacterales bacterium]|nr:CDP-diacylglycerol--glycerol-3-phosphate 3-phosphatidyltransferase [Desulfobacterales bacterium]
MNIPNIITIIRILLVPLLVIFLLDGRYDLGLLVFVTAGIGDGLDGLLARLLDQKTEFGARLDPIADKLLLVTSCVTLAVLGRLPGWVAVVIVSRDIIILGGIGVLMLNGLSPDIKPTMLGKMTTFFQLVTVSFFMGKEFVGTYWHLHNHLVILVIFFTLLSGFQYIILGSRILGQKGGNHHQ